MTLQNPIRVLLADDHAVVRSGLGAVLTSYSDLKLVGEAANGEEAVLLCARLNPDVVLMDLMMPVMDGVAATRAISEKQPGVHIIALTSFGEKDLVESAVKAGAMSYLLKTVTAAELVAAIRGTMTGKSSLSPEAAQALVQTVKGRKSKAADLTGRELEILGLMVDGLSNQEIAGRLVVSASTVKFHVSNILAKLGVTTRTEAVALALKQRVIK